MRSVGIKVLNSKLSEYVRLASAGETILVTDRDLVVAEIGPPASSRSATLDALHLATCEYLHRHGRRVELASFDRRMNETATAMNIPLLDPGDA